MLFFALFFKSLICCYLSYSIFFVDKTRIIAHETKKIADKNLNKNLFGFLIVTMISFKSYTQPISAKIFGQNAWMPDTIGSTFYKRGNLHYQWLKVRNSGAKYIRFGGHAPDVDRPTDYQYLKMVDSIRAHDMEPIIQVPVYKNKYTAADAAQIVTFLNVLNGRKIKYWVIGNEPD